MTILGTPTNLLATVVNGNSIKLTWDDIQGAQDSAEEGYLIERKVSGGEWMLLKSLVYPGATGYTDTNNIVADTGYYYRVRGYLTVSTVYIYVGKIVGVGWNAPESISVSGSGANLWISDTGNNKMRKYNRALYVDGHVEHFNFNGSGDACGVFSSPKGLADSGSGTIYFCDSGNNRILKYTYASDSATSPDVPAYATKSDSADTSFNSPCDIEVYSSLLYVTDRDNHRIQIRNTSNLGYSSKFGGEGSAVGDKKFSSPWGIAVDADNIYICDKGNDRVQIYNRTSFEYVGQFGWLNAAGLGRLNAGGSVDSGTLITDNGRLNQPTGIYVTSTKIYVSDSGNGRIQIFQKAAPYTYIGKTGTLGTGNGQFVASGLFGISLGSYIFAMDKAASSTGRVTIFNNS